MTQGDANVSGEASDVLSDGLPAGQVQPAAARWRDRLLVCVIVTAVAWFYAWTARTSGERWRFGAEQKDYYNLLVDGWRDGQLHLKVEVPEALLALKDPYDPAQRPPGLGLHDASLYRGKYHIYFGPAPAITLLLPFRALTGIALPLPVAIAVFTFGGFLVSAAVWLGFRRRYFPVTGPVTTILCLLALATASMGPVLIRRGNVWEVPLSSGYFFAMVAVACVWRSLHARKPRSETMWLAGAALGLGLAIASRPTYLFGVGLLAMPLGCLWWNWWRARRDVGAGKPMPLAPTLAVGAILGAIGGAMAWYNYARFGDPLEFGVRYMLSGIYESKSPHFGAAFFPFNLHLYFARATEWARYFPFVHASAPRSMPAGYFGQEEAAGLLTNFPMLVLGAWLIFARVGLKRHAVRRLWSWSAATALLALGTAMVLSFFYAAMARYEVDFAPALALIAGVGMLVGEHILRRMGSPRLGSGFRVAQRLLVVVSIACALSLSVSLYGDLQRLRPATYSHLARTMDFPTHWFERLTKPEFGPLECDVRFPSRPPGTRETLITTGWFGKADRIFVVYEGDAHVRIGFEHDNGRSELSRPVSIRQDGPQRLRVEMGSLYPPEEHPAFRHLADGRVAGMTRRLRVSLDRDVLLEGYQRFYPASPGAIALGYDPNFPPSAVFSGKITRVQRPESFAAALAVAAKNTEAAVVAGGGFDTIELELRFSARPAGAKEPLVVTGEAGRADFFFVEYLENRRIRFGFEHWGKPPAFGPAVEIQPLRSYHLAVSLGSFPSAHRTDPVKPEVEVWFDGTLQWNAAARFYPVEAADVFVGQNPIGGTACAAAFTGELLKVTRAISTPRGPGHER